jgi:hypothetical protein
MMIGNPSSPTARVLALVVTAALVDGRAYGADDSRIEVIIAEGVGVDAEGARKDAYRNAIRQAVGAYVDSETVVANDELITDRIVTLSPAFVEKAEPISGSEKKEEGLVRLRVRTHVRITKLLDALAAGRIKTRSAVKKVDTTSLLAELTTKSDQHEARREILAKLLSDYPESCLIVEQTGKESIEAQPNGRLFLRVPLSITPNQEAYEAFSTVLCKVLSATNRAGGTFKVDGSKYGPNPKYAKEQLDSYSRQAFTNTQSMLGAFPTSQQETIRRSCDSGGNSPFAGRGQAYLLWDGSERPGIDSLYYGPWRQLRENGNDDWIVVVATAAKKDFRQATWKWFAISGEEYREWFARAPASFLCHTELVAKDGDEVAQDTIEIGKIGAARLYPKLLWCVPLYVNLQDCDWYTPEFRLFRTIEIDTEDAANVDEIRIRLERGPPPER